MAYTAVERNMAYGVAAVDLYNTGRAIYQPEENRLPQERAVPQPQSVHRPNLVLYITAAVLVVAALLITFASARLYEVSAQVTSLESQLAALEEEQALLQSVYDRSVDLGAVEEYAIAQLGMSRQTSTQIVYINLSGTDRGEVLTRQSRGLWGRAVSLCREAFSNLGEYLS